MSIAGVYKLLQYYDNKKGAVEKSTAPYYTGIKKPPAMQVEWTDFSVRISRY